MLISRLGERNKMIKEFEGKNENDAINNAIAALGISREEIEIEIVENKKPLFFLGKGRVKIRVHLQDIIEDNIEHTKMIEFISQILKYMHIAAQIKIKEKDEKRVIIDIITKDSAILIGKKGKTLDALQLLINIIASKDKENIQKIVIDTENYRNRREKNLIIFARKVAEKVKKTRSSILLEAMNPFERRLIHTTLNKHKEIETISEGDGLYKKIRVLYKGYK